MTPEETKAALRTFVNLTIKGDESGEAAKCIQDVLQAKMQARIQGMHAGSDADVDTADAE